MLGAQLAFDVLELLAVFLLSVEAIKIRNLQWLREMTLVPLHSVLNPSIQFVEEFPPDAKFVERHGFALSLVGVYLLGVVILFLGALMIGLPPSALVPDSVPKWLMFVVGVILAPLLSGTIIYIALVGSIQRSIGGLAWIEARTRDGAVGILGFALYLFQFLGRRALDL